MTVQLRYLDINQLTNSAGGDPWRVNETIQSGSPGEISELATAFSEAGRCTAETSDEFDAAKQRFDSAWDRQDGGAHPINDSQEVRWATESLRINAAQMGRIAVDLQNIAASLAEAQRSGRISLGNLETALQMIDDQIGREIAFAAASGQNVDVSHLKQAAADRVSQALQEVLAVRGSYADQLERSSLEMASEGYASDATKGADGEGGSTPRERAQSDAEKYRDGQLASDQSLVNSPGAWTAAKQAAAGRLRDYATITDPEADPMAARYAGERLNDYHMAQYAGPLPKDALLGGDARSRAQSRLELQQQLERGFHGMPPQSPDAATRMLESAEAQSRMLVITRIEQELQKLGVSDVGIAQVLANLTTPADILGTGAKQYGESAPSNAFANLSRADLDQLSKWGGRLSSAANAFQFLTALDARMDGGSNEEFGKSTGSLAGSVLGGMASGAAAGSVAGPFTAAGAAVIGGILGGLAGGQFGADIGRQFDPVPLAK